MQQQWAKQFFENFKTILMIHKLLNVVYMIKTLVKHLCKFRWHNCETEKYAMPSLWILKKS